MPMSIRNNLTRARTHLFAPKFHQNFRLIQKLWQHNQSKNLNNLHSVEASRVDLCPAFLPSCPSLPLQSDEGRNPFCPSCPSARSEESLQCRDSRQWWTCSRPVFCDRRGPFGRPQWCRCPWICRQMCGGQDRPEQSRNRCRVCELLDWLLWRVRWVPWAWRPSRCRSAVRLRAHFLQNSSYTVSKGKTESSGNLSKSPAPLLRRQGM